MSAKLKPLRYPPVVKFAPTVHYGRLRRRLEQFLPAKTADLLAFDLMELDRACETFRRDIKRLYRALAVARRDATDLHDATISVGSDFLEFRYHIRRAERGNDKLYWESLTMPPLEKVTDEQWTKRAIAASYESLAKHAAKLKKKKTAARKAKKK